MEKLQLRQIALVAHDRDAVCQDIGRMFDKNHFHVDPAVAKFGLRNCVFTFGRTFLEVVSPITEGTSAGRLLDKRGGDGGYMVIVQTDDFRGARARIGAAGARIVAEYDQGGAAFLHIHPRDVGGALLSFDAMDAPDRWDWAGSDWLDHAGAHDGTRIVAADVQADAPDIVARRWGQIMGRSVERSGDNWLVRLDEGEIRFTPLCDERGEGLRGIAVATGDVDGIRRKAGERALLRDDGSLMICGTIIRLVEA